MSSKPKQDSEFIIAVRAPGQKDAEWNGYQGWTSVRLTTGIESCPGDFDISATDAFPSSATEALIVPGMECCIYIGKQIVLTGYVDRVSYTISGSNHDVRIVGRSKCADIVDCSAEFTTFQMINANTLQLAQSLCAPFGINVYAIGDIDNAQVPQFDVILSETPYDIIERVARYMALLAYDDHNGDLILSRVGSLKMSSGFKQGVNVQAAWSELSMDQRYSVVECVLLSVDTLFTDPDDPDSPTAAQSLVDDLCPGAIAHDTGVPRLRPLIIVAEQGDLYYQVAQQRCLWEVSRRWGRSQAIRVICDSWFDSDGNLWQKNALAPIDIPAVKISGVQWVIGSVTYLRDEQGTRADLTLMPPEAFLPEPIILQPYASPVYQAINPVGAANNGQSN